MNYRATIWPGGPGTKPTIQVFQTANEARAWAVKNTTSESQRLIESIPQSSGLQYFEDQVVAGALDDEDNPSVFEDDSRETIHEE